MKIKINPTFAQSILTPSEALDLLAPHLEKRKKRIHTLSGGAFMMGCDVDLTKVKQYLKKADADGIVLSGPNMKGMGHGVAVWTDTWLFLETDKDKLEAIYKLRKIK